jgi:hypothetical protein
VAPTPESRKDITNPASQKTDKNSDHQVSKMSMQVREASGKAMGSVTFPSNLSPFSSLKSAAWTVVNTMNALITSAKYVC